MKKNNKRIVVCLLAVSAILAGILAVTRMRREPDVPCVAVLPVPSGPVPPSPENVPAVSGGIRAPLAVTGDPRYDAREEARVAQRMQALIDAAEPVLQDLPTNVSPEFVVTPEEGLRRMAESTGMPVDARALKPYSRADFIREAAPADPPQP